VVATGAKLVAVRAVGTALAAAAVTVVLAGKQDADAATVAALSVRGLAVAAILCAAWGFQDRSRLGALQTARTWFWTAAAIGAAHALWIVATMPGGALAHLAAALSAFALDAVLVAAPALLGARAGRPDVRPTLV
jgi:apolipoprotein N-acyltransferase